MRKILSNKQAIVLFMLPTMLLIAVFVVIPIAMSVYYSLLDWDGIGAGIFVGLLAIIGACVALMYVL